ncbi:MAG: Uma2 family endonuclease [Limnospira sp. PMC 1256.20]|uniref:Uma2 family endonuclease n=1 Tax=Limnospira fusiformis PMC 851.14 TaxID=2219512 RepID=A0ABU9EHT4_LIMFS|nr:MULTISPECIES: Uma2 family endonuclease [unclassified Limnospira]MDT9213792.1 Uma2 family endonuclease [Limnospira sp. PMC 1256.20]MDT9244134.1 Uma2 family endonuclease [Limnospira sp. PMC 1249.20]MDT9285068.1 Uma2 family endonuclease [Limnospira sp. PMC 1298.21]
MIATPNFANVSPDDYLKLEEQSSVKHEYIDGEVYAMAGATDTHVTIALNMAIALRNHLRGSSCRVYISDMKVRIQKAKSERFYYPDILVTCDQRDRDTPTYKQFPQLIIEVLSDSTEAFDRGDKFMDYQSLDSLQEYILINTRHPRLEIFRRQDDSWLFNSYSLSEDTDDTTFHIVSLDFTEQIAAIYEDVNFNNQ